MRIFGISEASYYCSSFTKSIGDAEGSITEFKNKYLSGPRHVPSISEGSPLFNQYRDCSLRDVERSLFFAASNHRKSHDLMFSSSSPWAQVTLYYGSWYASRALLGMFGCTIFKKHIVDVNQGTLGNQELQLRKIGPGVDEEPTSSGGSHERFWDIFYNSIYSLVPMVSPRLSIVLSPIGGDPAWQIKNRNEINYDTHRGFQIVKDFNKSFSPAKHSLTLPGVLSTQFQILESLLEITCDFAKLIGLKTDALNGIGRSALFSDKVRRWIYTNKPGKIRKSKIKTFA